MTDTVTATTCLAVSYPTPSLDNTNKDGFLTRLDALAARLYFHLILGLLAP